MTRMQKYQSYREEIAKSSKLGYSIALDNKNIDKYAKEINKINPAILTSISTKNITLHKGVSEIALEQKQVPVEISKLFSTLNKAKNTINQENVSTIFFNITNSSIIDSNNKVKESWLKQNPDYASLSTFRLNLSTNPNADIQKNLETRLNDLMSTKKQEEIANVSIFAKDDTKQISHHIFVISVTVAAIFFVLTFALLITRMAI